MGSAEMAALSPWRGVLKRAVAVSAAALGGLALLRTVRRAIAGPAVHIFGWHVILDDERAEDRSRAGCIMPPLCVSRRSLAAQLDHLRRHYRVWPLADAAEAVAGRATLPRDREVAVLTFDDGYRSVLEHAAPLLEERGLPATVFVTTGVAESGGPLLHDRLYALVRRAARAQQRLVGMPVTDAAWPLAAADAALVADDPLCAVDAILSALSRAGAEEVADALAARVGEPGEEEAPRTLRWQDIAELRRRGLEIGAHTVSHAHLPLEDDTSLQRELEEPRRRLTEIVGAPPISLAYPAGRYDRRVVLAARRAGYRVGVTTEDRPCRVGDSPLRLGRKVITEGHTRGGDGRLSPALVAAQLDGLFRTLGVTHLERGDGPPEAAWIT
jgi:peptidoglycan/xylan/chitin deacetylase (PgdA/CDA1 family)